MEAFAENLGFISASCYVGQELELVFDAYNTDADPHTTEKVCHLFYSASQRRNHCYAFEKQMADVY